MKLDDVPAIWSHLPFQRGYPVPYFVAWQPQADGGKKPLFHLADPAKWATCLKYNKCWVCGKPLGKESFVVTGPKGLTNRVSTDTFLHEACARESLRLCPHLFYQKTLRREADSEHLSFSPHHDLAKPDEMALVKTGAFQIVHTGFTYVINYQPLAVQWFHYVEGELRAKTDGLESVGSTRWKLNLAGRSVVPLTQL